MTVTQFDDIVGLAQPTRPILPEDAAWIGGQIFEAETLLETRRGDLDTWVENHTNPDKARKIVVMVVNRMIQRVVKNPDGLFTETDGNYSYGRDKSLGSGEVYASPRDWAFLGCGNFRTPRTVRLNLPGWSPRNMSARG